MTRETVFTNARIVLADEVVAGSLVVRDGLIAEIGEGQTSRGKHLAGDFHKPGLIELQTEHLESHYPPRPGLPPSSLSYHRIWRKPASGSVKRPPQTFSM